MELLNNLRDICKKKIEEKKDEKYELIAKILEDDNCFFVIDMETAVDILSSLGIEDSIDYYSKLVSGDNYEETRIRVLD